MTSFSAFSIARMRSGSWRVLSKRFAKYGLTLHPEKTRLAGVRALGAAETARRAEAGDLRLPRLHARLCAQPTGAVHDSRSDHAQTPSAQCEGGGAVVPAASARPGRESGRGAQCQTPGSLPVLRAADELPQSVAVLSAGPAALAQVAQLGGHAGRRCPGDDFVHLLDRPSAASPAHLSCLGQSGESCVRNRVR